MEHGLGGVAVTPNWEDSRPDRVYLARDPLIARSYAETSDMVPEEWMDEIIVLHIRVSELIVDNFFPDANVIDGTDTFEYSGVIPAAAISLYVPETDKSPECGL